MITLISNYKLQNKQGKAQLILGFIIILLSFLGLSIALMGSIWKSHSFLHFLQLLWFNYFSYYTMISNILVLVFLILWVINFYKPMKVIRNGYFLTNVVCYIFLCFALYQVIFYNIVASGEQIRSFPIGAACWWIQSACLHLICPILFIIFFSLNLFIKKVELYNKIHYKYVALGILLPVGYTIYLIITFFTLHYSQYGDITAFWNFPNIKNPSFIVDPNIVGSWTNIFLMLLLDISAFGSLTLFYFMFNRFKQVL